MAYYDLDAVREVLPERLRALQDVIPAQSILLDLGCNDGRIAHALQLSGHAARVVGVDLERAPNYHGQEFLARDLRDGNLDGLPAADVVLFLNVAHHLLLQGRVFVRSLLAELLDRYPVVLIDMGSLTERDDWPWRGLMGRLWNNDAEMWAELFAPATWRRPLLGYPFQDGTRVLWKLVGPREQPYEYEELERWRRNATNDPNLKRFLPEDHPEAYDGVLFRKLRRKGTEELFWAKQPQQWRDQEARHAFEDQVEAVVKKLPVLASTSLERHPQWGRVYPFWQDLHDGPVIYYCTRYLYLTSSQCQQAERVAQATADQGPLANLPLGLLTDFQCVSTSIGMAFLDWEPDHQQPLVEEVLTGGEASRRRVQDLLYCPMNREAHLEAALDGAMQVASRGLTFSDRQRIAKDHLRRGQRLGRAARWRWSRVNYEAALAQGPPAFWAWLALLKWHLTNVARAVLGKGKLPPQVKDPPELRARVP